MTNKENPALVFADNVQKLTPAHVSEIEQEIMRLELRLNLLRKIREVVSLDADDTEFFGDLLANTEEASNKAEDDEVSDSEIDYEVLADAQTMFTDEEIEMTVTNSMKPSTNGSAVEIKDPPPTKNQKIELKRVRVLAYLATSATPVARSSIIMGCKVSPSSVGKIMTHAWFQYVGQNQYELSPAGIAEAVNRKLLIPR